MKCEKNNGLRPKGHAMTMINGLCGWCNFPDEVPLTPLRDLRTSDGKSGYVILEAIDEIPS